MIQSKLFVLKQEIELLWTEMTYERSAKPNGKPSSNVQGGLITVCFETTPKTDIILRWMTKDSLDDSLMELDKMEEGKVCFYANGYDYPPSKTYNFKDAFLVDYQQIFDSSNSAPMQSMITISPAIQNYGADVIKPWNVSYVPPSEEAPAQAEEKKEPRFLGYHFENANGTVIGQNNIKINDVIHLILETENAEGDTITLNLDDDDLDYKYNGKRLKNDVLRGVKVTGEITKIKLTAVAQQNQ
jgi:hypothetical protein